MNKNQQDKERAIEELDALLEKYDQKDNLKNKELVEIKESFLKIIQRNPLLLEYNRFATFLAHCITSEELIKLNWDSPKDMVHFSEMMHRARFRDEKFTTNLTNHVSNLIIRALHQYEKEGQMEKMFQLMRLAPGYLLGQSDELSRLHYQVNNYEVRRVKRGRQILYTYLAIQVLLVLFVFPFLFIGAENGRLQRQVEELTDVKIGDEGYQLLSYSEGVYWSIITAASIGYGDITPRTDTGRMIAAVLGTMGVLTVGILAGLVLDWITPRQIL